MIYELHVGTFTPEGTFDAAIPHLRGAARARRHRDRADAGRRVPRRATAGATTASTCRAAHSSYGGPHGARSGSSTPPTRAGLAVLLDVVYNHVGASGVQALEAFGPYFTEHVRDAWGRGDQLRRRRLATPSASGCCRAPRAGSATSTSTACGSTPSTRSSTPAPSTSSPALARRVHARDPRALVIAESGLNDPKVMRSARARRLGLRRRLGRRLPPRAARAAHRRPRAATTRSSARSRDLAKAFHRPHVHDGGYSTFRRRRFGAPRRRRCRPSAFVVFAQNHDQVGNRAFGDRLPRRGAPARRVLHAAVAVHADAVHGRGVRRARAVPVLLRPHRRGDRRSPRARAAGASSPPSPSSPARRSPTRRTRRRSSAPSSRAQRRARGPARPLRARCSRRAARSAAGRRRRDRLRRARRAGCACAAARTLVLANFARQRGPRPGRRAPVELVLATHHATVEPGYVVLPPLAGALVR